MKKVLSILLAAAMLLALGRVQLARENRDSCARSRRNGPPSPLLLKRQKKPLKRGSPCNRRSKDEP